MSDTQGMINRRDQRHGTATPHMVSSSQRPGSSSPAAPQEFLSKKQTLHLAEGLDAHSPCSETLYHSVAAFDMGVAKWLCCSSECIVLTFYCCGLVQQMAPGSLENALGAGVK